MSSIKDERGFNQGFKLTSAQTVRLHRRADKIIKEMKLPQDLKLRSNINILEIGCGTGELANIIQSKTLCNVVGLDISVKFIEIAIQNYSKYNLKFIVNNLTNDDLEKESYDYIVGNGILHHLYYNLETILPILKSLLKPNGKLIFWEPNYKNPYIYFIFRYKTLRKLAKLEPDEMAFTSNYIFELLLLNGFKNVSVTESDFLLPTIPKYFIKICVKISDFLDKFPSTQTFAQSLFISCVKDM